LVLTRFWAPDLSLRAAFGEMWRSLTIDYLEAIALFIGLELGATSHTFSDLLVSTYKKVTTKGLIGLIPQSIYKRFQSQGWSGLILPSSKKKKGRRKSSSSKLQPRTKIK
ncbi:MAG: metal-binding protein, partial [Okeania sp. SIO2H7]|nr:metal-binding protein [Okeania sp. SIO2H7]